MLHLVAAPPELAVSLDHRVSRTMQCVTRINCLDLQTTERVRRERVAKTATTVMLGFVGMPTPHMWKCSATTRSRTLGMSRTS